MMRKLIAVAAVSGSLALCAAGMVGTAGVAGAAAPSAPTTTVTPTTRAAKCDKAETRATRIEAREAKAAAWLPKAQVREAEATAAGHTKVAAKITNRITRVQKWETRGTAVLAKISAKCGSSSSISSSSVS